MSEAIPAAPGITSDLNCAKRDRDVWDCLAASRITENDARWLSVDVSTGRPRLHLEAPQMLATWIVPLGGVIPALEKKRLTPGWTSTKPLWRRTRSSW